MKKIKTVIIGFGKIGGGFKQDKKILKNYKYPSHVSVLKEHPLYSLDCIVDHSSEARKYAKKKWNIKRVYESTDIMIKNYKPDVAVVSTSSPERNKIISKLNGIKGMMLEKPVGDYNKGINKTYDLLKKKKINVQVNFWRRGNKFFRELARKNLKKWIGKIHIINAYYVGGFLNNGTHMIDFVRMMTGNIKKILPLKVEKITQNNLVDYSVLLSGELLNGAVFNLIPMLSKNYRENGIEVFGSSGQISLLQESRQTTLWKKKKSNLIQGSFELDKLNPVYFKTSYDESMYHLYTNLADSILKKKKLYSSLDQAVIPELIFNKIINKYKNNEKNFIFC